MNLGEQLALVEEFERSTAALRLRKVWEFYAQEQQTIEHRRDDEKEREKEKALFAEVIATEQEIAEFHQHLDAYDTATVDALMDNRQRLDAANAKLDDVRAHAYELSDGRRIYKTQDGKDVFDESGHQLSRAIIDPDLISGAHSTKEQFDAAVNGKAAAEHEKSELLAYQARLDEARDKSDKQGISKRELDAIDADLKKDMPVEVARKLAQSGAEAGVSQSVPGSPLLSAPANTSYDRPTISPQAFSQP